MNKESVDAVLSGAPATSAETEDARVWKSLQRVNELVHTERCEMDLLMRLVLDPNSSDLSQLVKRIGALVLDKAREHNASRMRRVESIRRNGDSVAARGFTQNTIDDASQKKLRHLFEHSCGANDECARVTQLFVLFAGLMLDVDVRNALLAEPKFVGRADVERDSAAQQTARAAATTAAAASRAAERARVQRASQIDRETLMLFLQNDMKRLTAQLMNGDVGPRQFVSNCIACYFSYQRALPPELAQRVRAKLDASAAEK